MIAAAAYGLEDKIKEALKNNANVNAKEQVFVSYTLL